MEEEQLGFVPRKGTKDAIFAARQMIEKHRGRRNYTVYMVFVDLEKAYARVPRQEVWRCMREKGVPEKYVRIVKDTYVEVRTKVKNSESFTSTITVRVGLHQGSSLSPYLFDLVMDVLGRGIKEQPPWCMLFADDIVLCSTRREEVERKLGDSRTEYWSSSEQQDLVIRLEGEEVKRVKTFKYLGSTLAEDG